MTTDLAKYLRSPIPSNIQSHLLRVDPDHWLMVAQDLRQADARFLSLWGADDRNQDGCFRVYAAWLLPQGVLVLEHAIRDVPNPSYPDISHLFPAALRMQRASLDLLGIAPPRRRLPPLAPARRMVGRFIPPPPRLSHGPLASLRIAAISLRRGRRRWRA